MGKSKIYQIMENVEKGNLKLDKAHQQLFDIYEILPKKQLEGFRKKIALEYYKKQQRGREFVICIHDGVEEIASRLTTTQAGALMRLLPYMKFKKDGLLVKDGKPMTVSVMADIIGKSERTTKTMIKALIESGALTKNGTNRNPEYVVNPMCHIMGKAADVGAFTRLYKNEGKHLINLLSIQEQGFVYKMIPYINFETTWLAENPKETDAAEVIPLSKSKMAMVINESIDTVERHLKQLWRVGIIDTYGSHGREGYLFNPDLLHIGHNSNSYYQARSLFKHSLLKQEEYQRYLLKQSSQQE